MLLEPHRQQVPGQEHIQQPEQHTLALGQNILVFVLVLVLVLVPEQELVLQLADPSQH